MPQVFQTLSCLAQYLPLIAVAKLFHLLLSIENNLLNHFVHIRLCLS